MGTSDPSTISGTGTVKTVYAVKLLAPILQKICVVTAVHTDGFAKGISIVPLSAANTALLKAVGAVYRDVFQSKPWSKPWTEHQAQLRLRKLLRAPASFGLAAMVDGEAVGCAVVRGEPCAKAWRGVLHELFVRADRRSEGVGHRLVQEVRAECLRRGFRTLIATTHREADAVRFLKGQGFQEQPTVVHLGLSLA